MICSLLYYFWSSILFHVVTPLQPLSEYKTDLPPAYQEYIETSFVEWKQIMLNQIIYLTINTQECAFL